MTKTITICDFCEKDITNKDLFADPASHMSYSIYYNGIQLDICEDCRLSFCEWIKSRKCSSKEV